MPGPNDKKPNLFTSAMGNIGKKADGKITSPTEMQDNRKRKAMVTIAAEEKKMRPESATANRTMIAAMAVDEAFKLFRQALAALRAGLPDAAKREQDLRVLKATVEEDIAANAQKVHPSIPKLSQACEVILREARRVKK